MRWTSGPWDGEWAAAETQEESTGAMHPHSSAARDLDQRRGPGNAVLTFVPFDARRRRCTRRALRAGGSRRPAPRSRRSCLPHSDSPLAGRLRSAVVKFRIESIERRNERRASPYRWQKVRGYMRCRAPLRLQPVREYIISAILFISLQSVPSDLCFRAYGHIPS